jgi:tRNA-splicing endonuclease subunit Sen34
MSEQQQEETDIYETNKNNNKNNNINNNNNNNNNNTSFESLNVISRRQHVLQTGPLRSPLQSSSSTTTTSLIDVIVCHGGLFLVWRPDDVFRLRSHFRIVGSLVGSLPFAAQQNDTASLPLALAYEEVALLHRLAVVRLTPLLALPAPRSAAARAERLAHAVTLDRIRCSVGVLHRRVLELKHRAAAAKKKRKDVADDAAADADVDVFTASLADVDDLDAKLAASAAAVEQLFAAYSAAVPINGTTDGASDDADANDANDSCGTLPPMPVSSSAAHCAVFADLWQRGFFLTSASKFGGDFLAYMGDPLKFHAAYVVVVARSAEPLLLCEIAALGRLANAVKKTGVVASFDVRCLCGADVVCRHDIVNDEHAALTADEFAALHHGVSEVRYLTIDWRSMTK